MLRVESGHPRAALGHPPKLFGYGACGRDWMGGDPGAFGQVLTDQPVGVLVGSPFPRGKRMSEVHLHVGCRSERGMTGASPKPLTPRTAGTLHHITPRYGVDVIDQHIIQTLRCSFQQ